MGKKVTFKNTQSHLQEVYKRKFSYGTVVQLCVARNRHRRSAANYRGIAKVTCRRARKGFAIKYNPDSHWSSAFYCSLNSVQYVDGRNIVNLNRDDAAVFHLDTLSTHRLHATPTVKGKEILTTYTDYVTKYPSTLQTTSYNFSATRTTPELCAGIVKASVIFLKNAAQHASDLEMVEEKTEFRSAFYHPQTGLRKPVECVRVDGAADEGPMHEEVQFFWSARHLEKGYYATYVTARCSGQSYLNRVELQNGCLALGHSNLFIPSTLIGSNMDSSKVNYEKLRQNLDLAMDVYIDRVENSPCGAGSIKLFKGADSSSNQEIRKYLLQFLKGNKAQKKQLQEEHQEVYDYLEKVWNIRNDHMLPNIPTQYCNWKESAP